MTNTATGTQFVAFESYDLYIKNERVDSNTFQSLLINELHLQTLIKKTGAKFQTATIRARSVESDLLLYDPLLEAQGLFTELLKIPLIWEKNYDVKPLMKFIQHFGLPIGTDISKGRMERVLNHEMNFAEFNDLLGEYKRIIDIWLVIKENDVDKINLYAKEYDVSYNFNFKGGIIPSSNVQKAFYILSNELNKKKKEEYTFVLSNGTPKKVYTFSNLFEVAYFQLSNFIDSGEPFKRCKHCEAIFTGLHSSRLFCNDMPGNSYSLCGNGYKQRVARDKARAIQLKNEGKSIQEILEITNKNRNLSSLRTEEEIKGYISKK